jgi:hypothetical protein
MSTNYGWGAGEMEGPFEYGQQESQYGEFEGQNGEFSQEAEGVFAETDEMELAADMLSLGSEMELEQAIGKLMHGAARAVGGSIPPEVGTALGNAIKAAAQQAAPLGSTPAAASGELFGIEPEGLSGEDQEFEVMRRFVRFAGAAAGRAARFPRGVNPRAIVRSALTSAARRWAPGLLRRWSGGSRNPGWQRRRWHHHRRWGAGARGYGYGYPYSNQYPQPPYPQPSPYQQPYPGAPGFPGAQQQPASPFDPNAAGGFGGAPDASGGAMTQGMPDSGGGDFGSGGEGPVPQSGRWTRQNGQLTIHI